MQAAVDQANQLIASIGQKTGAPDIRLNSAGVCTFLLHDHVEVTIELPGNAEFLYVTAGLGRLHDTPPVGLLRTLLAANCKIHEPHGFVLGLDDDFVFVRLFARRALASLTEVKLEEWLELFLETAWSWHDEIRQVQDLHHESDQEEAAGARVPPDHFVRV